MPISHSKESLHGQIICVSRDETNFRANLQIVVVLIGTNNHGDSAEDIAEAIIEICSLIREKQPQAYIVLLVSGFNPEKRDKCNFCGIKINAA